MKSTFLEVLNERKLASTTYILILLKYMPILSSRLFVFKDQSSFNLKKRKLQWRLVLSTMPTFPVLQNLHREPIQRAGLPQLCMSRSFKIDIQIPWPVNWVCRLRLRSIIARLSQKQAKLVQAS